MPYTSHISRKPEIEFKINVSVNIGGVLATPLIEERNLPSRSSACLRFK